MSMHGWANFRGSSLANVLRFEGSLRSTQAFERGDILVDEPVYHPQLFLFCCGRALLGVVDERPFEVALKDSPSRSVEGER